MQVFTTLSVLFLCGLASATDERVSVSCLRGETHRDQCCEGVPDAWYAHLRNPTDCASFYQCEHGKPTWKACAEGTHWSVAADRCESPQEAGCVVDQPSTESPATNGPTSGPTQGPTQAPTEGPTKAPEVPKLPSGCYDGSIDAKTCCVGVSDFWVHLPDPEDCGKFYQCDNGIAVHKDCPAGLNWSVAEDRCEWPDKAGCIGSGSSTARPTEKPTQKPTEKPTQKPTQAPTERPTSSTAPPTSAPPTSPPTTEAPPPPPPQPEDECEPEPVCHQCLTGILPADLCCRDVKTYHKLELANGKNCSSYYQCVGGKAILRQCPKGLHWSVDTERCEYPNVAKCNSNGNGGNNGGGNNGGDGNNGGNDGGSNGGDGNNGGNEGGNGGNNGNGGASSDCLNGKASAEECCRGVPPTVDLLLQNNEDCHTFIQCVNEKPMVRPCPAGLWWSITRNRCEWIENATCTW